MHNLDPIMSLEGKKAFVSGGSHGIGLSIAKNLISSGCDVIISSRNITRLEQAKRECEEISKYKCTTISGDVLKEEDVNNIIEFVSDLGGVDILINNVGGGGRWGKNSPTETPLSVWREVLEKNYWTAVKFTMSFLPFMVTKKWGRVICITSAYGTEKEIRPWFNVAKEAEAVLMKNLSTKKEYARNGITFNIVAPGDIMISDTGWDEIRKTRDFGAILEKYPIGRMGIPEDVSSVVSFLCGHSASYVNGACITVDGGQSNLGG